MQKQENSILSTGKNTLLARGRSKKRVKTRYPSAYASTYFVIIKLTPMDSRTLNKLTFLQAYARKRFTRWAGRHKGNIVGVRVDRKYSNGKKASQYSIVFHVAKKFDDAHLSPRQRIPPYYSIKFPDGKMRRVPTDVHETGRFSFQSEVLDEVKDITAGKAGKIGVFVRDGQKAFAVTNYHVAAGGLMAEDILFFDASSGEQADTLFINDQREFLNIGIFSTELDVAFVTAGDSGDVSNRLPGDVTPRDFVPGPIDSTWNGKSVFIFSKTNPEGTTVRLRNNSTTFDPQFPGVSKIVGAVAIDRCTNHGDSGSLVLSNDLQVLGIVTGADDSFTYVIPYYKIFNFNKLPIL